jgi:tetratricopeptide repeat protein 21B
MLGEALMQIQEPEKAVRAFEDALEYQPKVGGASSPHPMRG